MNIRHSQVGCLKEVQDSVADLETMHSHPAAFLVPSQPMALGHPLS